VKSSLFVICTLASVLTDASLAAGEDAGSIPWRSDLEAARKEALRASKPLLVVFR
jgi:hypothetical protein